jgi:hypothetical protein
MPSDNLTSPAAWLTTERSELGMGRDPHAIADRLMSDIDADLISRSELDLGHRIEATMWLARQLAIEVDRMATSHLANGATYQQVADMIGITRQAAHHRYHRK